MSNKWFALSLIALVLVLAAVATLVPQARYLLGDIWNVVSSAIRVVGLFCLLVTFFVEAFVAGWLLRKGLKKADEKDKPEKSIALWQWAVYGVFLFIISALLQAYIARQVILYTDLRGLFQAIGGVEPVLEGPTLFWALYGGVTCVWGFWKLY